MNLKNSELNLNIFLINSKRGDSPLPTKVKEDIIITTPIGTKLNIQKDLIITNPMYIDHYEPFYEESSIKDNLDWLEGEDRENYIRLEEEQNPIHFKIFREEYPEYFE